MNNSIKERLKSMLCHKKSQAFYAKKLGISITKVKEIIAEIRGENEENTSDRFRNYEEDLRKERGVVSFSSDREIQSLDDLIEMGNIDTSRWNIEKYIQNAWGNSQNQKWQVKAWLSPISQEDKFTEVFLEELHKVPKITVDNWAKKQVKQKTGPFQPIPNGYLLLNKQDAHYNKFDVNGKNDIYARFAEIESKMQTIVNQSKLSSSLKEIIYVIGSDAFNSEWTLATTKGTPQLNLLTYTESFELILQHEIRSLSFLSEATQKLKVVYVPGNHDEHVGWHLINTLKHFFSNYTNMEFSESMDDTKCLRVDNTAIMLNHGDVMKARDLASKFPMIFKEEWSYCDNFYIFTGDKHHLKAEDINGIQFFQLPSLSQAKSRWDIKQGHICTDAEMMGFLIKDKVGMSNIYKEKIYD